MYASPDDDVASVAELPVSPDYAALCPIGSAALVLTALATALAVFCVSATGVAVLTGNKELKSVLVAAVLASLAGDAAAVAG